MDLTRECGGQEVSRYQKIVLVESLRSWQHHQTDPLACEHFIVFWVKQEQQLHNYDSVFWEPKLQPLISEVQLAVL